MAAFSNKLVVIVLGALVLLLAAVVVCSGIAPVLAAVPIAYPQVMQCLRGGA